MTWSISTKILTGIGFFPEHWQKLIGFIWFYNLLFVMYHSRYFPTEGFKDNSHVFRIEGITNWISKWYLLWDLAIQLLKTWIWRFCGDWFPTIGSIHKDLGRTPSSKWRPTINEYINGWPSSTFSWIFGDFQPFFHGKDLAHHQIETLPFINDC